MENFKDKYTDINLVRNEEVYKIYDFKTGKGFMPDFLLFMKSKNRDLFYQVFIEPKGSQFMDSTGTFDQSKEAWKQEFLDEITKRYAGDETLLKKETDEYKLIGLPLYNESSANQFKQGIKEALDIKI